ncbi:MAG: FMNH2-dependent alkanesulfonate monooxygenase [Chloroflexi bacterium]|uniref:FMNH2-dependent alkanesulfonate monooxygenase n=1 Tax=Candidatus Flexifilum breve TaxID=3140694 RepID=UPI00313499CE|nr:FMNH2-dependent alkanesulfonate monooxygenase [Chloroflexota bacterium]
MEILWFIPGHGDTRYLGTQISRRNTSASYLETVARAVDTLGFTGALLPTGAGCEDSWMLAASLIPLTQRMKFLIAVRPGSLSVTLAARMAATFDRLSGGRLLLNIITGGDPVELAGDGTFLSHDERYRVTDEFLTIWRQLFSGQPVDFAGDHLRIEGGKLLLPPVQRPYPPLYFGGSSPVALEVSAKHVDVYLSLAEPPAMMKEKFDRVREHAARFGRTVRFGVRAHIFVRERAEDAWKAAENVLRYADDTAIAASQAHLARFDSVGQARMASLHNGSREALEVSPNLWAGIGLINKGVGTALVGDPDTLAERLQEYVDIGADSFILSSYPHLEETYQVAELLFPRLPAWRDKLRQRDDVFSPDRLPTTWQ